MPPQSLSMLNAEIHTQSRDVLFDVLNEALHGIK